MAALAAILARLGLSQYLDRFEAEGFDTWETLLEITESDLYGHATTLMLTRLTVFQGGIGCKTRASKGQCSLCLLC